MPGAFRLAFLPGRASTLLADNPKARLLTHLVAQGSGAATKELHCTAA